MRFSVPTIKKSRLWLNDSRWIVAVDGIVWTHNFDMVWQPVFDPDSNHVAVKFEQDGKYGIALDDHVWAGRCDDIWDPVFSSAGDKILLRSLKDGIYSRQVLPVSDMLR